MIFAGSSRIVAGTSMILERISKILEDYRWRSSKFPFKILIQIFKDL